MSFKSFCICSTNLKNIRGGCKRCVERIDIKHGSIEPNPLKTWGIQSLPTNKRIQVYPPTSAEELSACWWSQLRQAILRQRVGLQPRFVLYLESIATVQKKRGSISAWILSIFVPNTLMNCGNTLKGTCRRCYSREHQPQVFDALLESTPRKSRNNSRTSVISANANVDVQLFKLLTWRIEQHLYSPLHAQDWKSHPMMLPHSQKPARTLGHRWCLGGRSQASFHSHPDSMKEMICFGAVRIGYVS